IGHDLGVRFVLEGSIRKAGNRVRITAQLIDAGSGGHLWAERFDRDLTDIFATQDAVVEKIVRALAVTLTQGETRRVGRRGAGRALELDDQEPVSHLALGNVLVWRRNLEGALAEFRRMIELDPNFAQGHSATGLALMYAGRPAEALEAFAIAKRLDPHHASIVLHFMAQTHFSLGQYETAAKQLLERLAR